MCCSVSLVIRGGQYVAVCCSVLRCVAMCCSVSLVIRGGQYVAVCCSVLKCVAMCCHVLQCVSAYHIVKQGLLTF